MSVLSAEKNSCISPEQRERIAGIAVVVMMKRLASFVELPATSVVS